MVDQFSYATEAAADLRENRKIYIPHNVFDDAPVRSRRRSQKRIALIILVVAIIQKMYTK